MADTKDLRATRIHKILAARQTQLVRNLKAKDGGGDYINARLGKFPCESRLSWEGAGDIPPRKDRAFLINYAGRIVSKINQYVFGQDIDRAGISEEFEQDATKTGMSIDRFMSEVSGAYSAGQWAWIGVDRGSPGIDPETGQPATRSLAEKEAAGDRIFWTLWDSTEVKDWRFGVDGSLEWLITEECLYSNSDPAAAAQSQVLRTIWVPGGGTRLWLDPDDPEKVVNEQEFTISANLVPFECVGFPSPKPYWFDDVERVQASILNLESAHHENLIQAVFPQLVLSADLVEDVMRLSGKSYDDALELVRGIEYPLLETDDSKGLTRYLIPSAQDLKAIPDEQGRRRAELFEVVGLALARTDTKQVQSAASKAWDHLDPSATLANRAALLEETERAVVDISKSLDSDFKTWDPAYPRQFNMVDMLADLKTVIDLQGLTLPPSAIRESMRIGVELLDHVRKIPEDRKRQIMDDIKNMDDASLDAFVDATAPDRDAFDALDPDADPAGDAGEIPIDRIPLAIQNLSLAQSRAKDAGNDALVSALGAKLDALTRRIA